MLWDVTGDSLPANDYNWDTYGTLNPFGDYNVAGDADTWTGWNYTGELTGAFDSGNDWILQWTCVFNDDVDGVATGGGAFVTANIVVTNNDVDTQNFSLLMTLPVGRLIENPGMLGSIVGTVTDLTFDDATVFAPDGSQIYTPIIDLNNQELGFLMTDPFDQSAGGPFQSSTVGPEDFGAIAAEENVDDTIAIMLSFDLTAGDSASFTAIFEVFPDIPGPAGLPLLALGLLAGGRRRRR